MKIKRYTFIILTCLLISISLVSCIDKTSKQQDNDWIVVSYEDNYFENALSAFNNGHFPWRLDAYQVAKEFLSSNFIKERVLGDVKLLQDSDNTYNFETEDNKKIEVHVNAPFKEPLIYFVDKYRYN